MSEKLIDNSQQKCKYNEPFISLKIKKQNFHTIQKYYKINRILYVQVLNDSNKKTRPDGRVFFILK